MNFINPPAEPPKGFTHHTFYSSLYGHELGYCVYLPDDYESSAERYPVCFHLHGWTGNEASEIRTMAAVCQSRKAITVFSNSSPAIGDRIDYPVEEMLTGELMPLIDRLYRTHPAREARSISGFSMGAGMAMYYVLRRPELFSAVTAYAGTYHHYFYYTDFRTVGAPAEKAADFYHDLLTADESLAFDKNILTLVQEKASVLRTDMQLSLHIGTKDVLYCDNEILRLHLDRLGIPYEYKTYEGAEHRLADIL